MNPTTPAAPQPAQPVPNTPQPGTLTPNLVENIPMQTFSAPANEDGDMDKILQDVNNDLKKDDHKPAKRHLFSKKHPAPAAQPQPAPSPGPAQPAVTSQLPQPAAHTAAPAAKPKAAPKEHGPMMVTVMTIIVTGVLIAAAIYSYKK